MNAHADKIQKNKSQSVSAAESQMNSGGESTFQFVDNRPEAVAQRKLQEMPNNSPHVKQLRVFQEIAKNSPQTKHAAQMSSMPVSLCSPAATIQRVDTVLGAGAQVAITAGMNLNSPYTGNLYLRGIANQLTGAGLSPGDTQNLMTAMGIAIRYQGKYTRCATVAANMATANVPFALIRPLILNHAVGMPAGNHADLTGLATDLRAWTYGHVNPLMTGPNPNAFTLTELGNIARRVPANASADALTYIGFVGWVAGAIENIAIGRGAGNPNNLTVAEWVAIGTNLPVDDHATTIAIAQIPGWQAVNLANLATQFAGVGGADIAHWTLVAAVLPNLPAEIAAVVPLAGRVTIVNAITANRLTGPQLTALLAHNQLGNRDNLARCFAEVRLTSGAHLLTLLDTIGAGRLTGLQLIALLQEGNLANSAELVSLINEEMGSSLLLTHGR